MKLPLSETERGYDRGIDRVWRLEEVSRMNEAPHLIRYYDEVLTQSARNYAFSQNKKWVVRYQDTKAKLNRLLEETVAKEDFENKRLLESIDKANQKLLAMESRSIQLVDNGQAQQALAILDGTRYVEQKEIYSQSLKNYFKRLSEKLSMALPAYPTVQYTDEEKAWLAQHPIIEIGTETGAAPYHFADDNGDATGVIADLAQALERRLGVDLVVVPQDTSTAYQSLRQGTYPIAGFNSYSALEPSWPYRKTLPMVAGYISLFCKTNREDRVDPGKLRGATIAHLYGLDKQKLEKLAIHNRLLKVESIEEGIGALLEERADYYIEFAEVVKFNLRKTQQTVIREVYTWPDPVDAGLLVSNDAPLLRSILIKALANIKRDEMPRILDKWYQWGVYVLPEIKLTDSERAWLDDHPNLRLVTDKTAVPYSYVDEQGRFAGILEDVCARLETLLGIQFSFETIEYHEIVEHVKKADRDIISGFDPLDAPFEEHYLKTDDILFMPFALFALEDSDLDSQGLSALSGKRVAILKGWDTSHPALDPFESCEFVFADTPLGCVNLVLQGKADAVFEVASLITNLINQKLIQNIRMVHMSNQGMPLTILVKKEWSEFHSALNKALDTFGAEDRIALLKKWSAYPDSPGFRLISIDLTEEERRWLTEPPVIRIGSDPKWAPIEFIGKQGKPQGIAIDYLHRVEKLLGVRFEINTQGSWQELINKAKRRELDMFSCVSQTPERSEYLYFTEPYLEFPIVIFTRQDVAYISGLDQLKGKKVALVGGYAVHDLFARNHPDIELCPTQDVQEGLELVNRGEVLAFAGNLLVVSNAIAEQGYTSLKVSGETPYRNRLAMGVRGDWPIFAGILQKALDTISPQERNAIQQRWISLKYEHKFDYSLLWKVTLPVLLIAFVISFWNWRLARAEIAERKIEKSKFEVLFNQSIQFTGLLATDGTMLAANRTALAFVDYDESALVGKPFWETPWWTHSKMEQERLREAIGQAAKGEVVHFETTHLFPDGSLHYFDFSLKPVLDDAGSVTMLIPEGRDITERKKVEEARSASLRLNQMMERSSQREIIAAGLEEGVSLTGSRIGYFHFVNPNEKTLSLQCWSQNTLRACTATEVDTYYPVDKAGVWVDCIRERRPVIHNDYQALPHKKGLPAGHVPIVREMAVPVFEDEGIVAVIGVGNKSEDYNQYDIDLLSILTESLWSIVRKKRFEEELVRLNAELEQRVERRTRELAQANKDLESFSYSVSHDLRAPLRHISGYVNLLNRPSTFKDDEKRSHYMDMILDSSRHMGQLIDDLLVFSRMGRTGLHKEPVNLNELIEDVLRKQKPEIGDRTVNWKIEELPEVSGDRNMLRIVMDNLISNALKYTRRETVAEIEIGCREEKDNLTVISIRDNGVGFNMTYAHKLFGVFQRLHGDEEFEGTGIGLATVERIIQRHGGTVWAESEEGEGATFNYSIQIVGTK